MRARLDSLTHPFSLNDWSDVFNRFGLAQQLVVTESTAGCWPILPTKLTNLGLC